MSQLPSQPPSPTDESSRCAVPHSERGVDSADVNLRPDVAAHTLTAAARAAEPRKASVLVVDPAPLSLLALAGVLHDQGFQCVCARDKAMALRAIELGPQDMVVWDVSDDAIAALEALQELRNQPEHTHLPAVLLAESRWAGLEKKTETLVQSTCCLFRPIDPHALGAITQRMLWLPQLEASHRRRGTRPTRPGWVTL